MSNHALLGPFAATCEALDDPSDLSLLTELRDGNDAAAELLYQRYAQRLMALTQKSVGKDLAHRFDPDDVLQSVFRSFFEHAREGLYDIPAAGDLWPLLLVIALHKVRAYGKFHRAARRNIRREQGSSGDDTASGAVDRMESSEPQPLIRLMAEETLEQMPPQYHQIMRWRLEGYDHAEIASMAGRSKRSVERIFQECRAIFQQQLPDYPHGCSEHSS